MPSKVKLPRPDKAPKCHVRTGDKVVVTAGDSRGKTGTVIRVFPFEQRALVEGEAAIHDTKHVRANPQAGVQGGRIKRLRKIHLSNLSLLDPTTNKPTRVRRERSDAGVARVAIKSGHRFENTGKYTAPESK